MPIDFGNAVDEQGQPNPVQTSESLGVTVTFIDPLLGRHEKAYQEVIDAKDKEGNPAGSLGERRFAAALTLIKDVTFEDEAMAVDVKAGKYDDLPVGLLRWLGTKAWNYYQAVIYVPFG